MNGYSEDDSVIFYKRIKQFTIDPVARKTEWTNLCAGVTNFRTHKLIKHDSVYIIKETINYKITLFLIYLIPIYLIYATVSGQNLLMPRSLYIPIALLIITYVTYKLLTFNKKIFNAKLKIFLETRNIKHKKIEIPFEQIYALQVIQVESHGDEGMGTVKYSLNIVLSDSNRLFLADFCKWSGANEVAEELSSILDRIPIWDISDEAQYKQTIKYAELSIN